MVEEQGRDCRQSLSISLLAPSPFSLPPFPSGVGRLRGRGPGLLARLGQLQEPVFLRLGASVSAAFASLTSAPLLPSLLLLL